MDTQDLKVHIEEIIPRPVHVVFDTITKREKLVEFFPYGASSDLALGEKIIWDFNEYGTVELEVKKIQKELIIVFVWSASGVDTKVEMLFTPADDNSTRLEITETGWPLDELGAKRAMEQTHGWADFLARLKAYVGFGIDLRTPSVVPA